MALKLRRACDKPGDDLPDVADRPDGARRLPADRLGGRSAWYGKTTLLAQWAARDREAFAWVSLDERDNDPKVLLSYVAEGAGCGRAGRGAGVRGAGFPGQFGARVGGAEAVLSVLGDDGAGSAGV